jgi:hypothetical protein
MNINLLLLYQIFIHLLVFWFHRRVMALLACDVVRYVGAKVPRSTAPMSSLPVLTLIAPPAPKPCIASMVGVSPEEPKAVLRLLIGPPGGHPGRKTRAVSPQLLAEHLINQFSEIVEDM